MSTRDLSLRGLSLILCPSQTLTLRGMGCDEQGPGFAGVGPGCSVLCILEDTALLMLWQYPAAACRVLCWTGSPSETGGAACALGHPAPPCTSALHPLICECLVSIWCFWLLVPHAAAIWCLWLLVPHEVDPQQVLPGALAFMDAQRSGPVLPDSTGQFYPWLKPSSSAGLCLQTSRRIASGHSVRLTLFLAETAVAIVCIHRSGKLVHCC